MHSSPFHQKLFKFSGLSALLWPTEFQFTSALDGRTTVKKEGSTITESAFSASSASLHVTEKGKVVGVLRRPNALFSRIFLFACFCSLCPLRRFEKRKKQQK